MITAFDVYFVMQLDDIKTFLIVAAAMSIMPITFIVIEIQPRRPVIAKLMAAWTALAFSAALVPSTQTMAAMLILPKITQPEIVEPVSAELEDLYRLAKDALKSAAGGE